MATGKKDKDLKFEIVQSIAVLSTDPKNNWTKEFNYVSWNGKEPKYEIRAWSPDHNHMGKGVTFTEEELAGFRYVLNQLFEG